MTRELISRTLHQIEESVTRKEWLAVKITEAIKTADTEHVVYFLLTAYVETIGYYDPLRSSVPSYVKRLPVTGIADVSKRLGALRMTIERYARSKTRLLIEEAVEIFSLALQRLTVLQNAPRFAITMMTNPPPRI